MDAWPAWLNEDEQKRLKHAAEGDSTGTAIIAACLYLGLYPISAARMTTGRAYGDALENRTKKAFLHIPNEYKCMVCRIDPPEEGKKGENTRLTTCTKEQAAVAIERVFIRAGIDPENAVQRLRRTAAELHFWNKWTPQEQIEKWFSEEIKQARPGEPGAAYYKTILTDEQLQARADEGAIKMGGIVGEPAETE